MIENLPGAMPDNFHQLSNDSFNVNAAAHARNADYKVAMQFFGQGLCLDHQGGTTSATPQRTGKTPL